MPSTRQNLTSEATPAVSGDSNAAAAVSSTVLPASQDSSSNAADAPVEIGGRDGPEPTRFGDWERRGRCIDF